MRRFYRRKPVVVQAEQYDGTLQCAARLCDDYDTISFEVTEGRDDATLHWAGYLTVQTPEGPLLAAPGDWIITGVMGENYPVKPDVFERTYELVPEAQA